MDYLLDSLGEMVLSLVDRNWSYHPRILEEVVGFYSRSLWLIPLFPLVGFLINAAARKKISRSLSGVVASTAAGCSFVWALVCFLALRFSGEEMFQNTCCTWLDTETFKCSFGLLMDQLSGTMLLFVTGIGTLIHIYSIGYMSHDKSYARYFAYLNLFLFSMLVLVLGSNLVLMFVGWEGVGLCSYLLIGFWFEDPEKAKAGMKAFVFNRIGDLGFLLGIFALVAVFGTVDFRGTPAEQASGSSLVYIAAKGEQKEKAYEKPGLVDYGKALGVIEKDRLQQKVGGELSSSAGTVNLGGGIGRRVFPGWTVMAVLTFACCMLFLGACGKSAQIPLYAWLPDAMAGPTPVSALIHAATMVTAGVYMVARLFPLFHLSEFAMGAVALIGALTAIFAALIALTQTDIKKVLAYSTVSQLGYMFVGVGAGAWSLGIFHVVTHAFFKALLFLCAGSVIHALSGEQDMRKMGGLRKKLPITFVTMFVGALALAGVPGTAGWCSKDQILGALLAQAGHGHHAFFWYTLYVLAAVAALCTAFYTFRLIFVTFFGEERLTDEAKAHLHESPAVMTVPLIILAFLAAFGGLIWWGLPTFLNPHLEAHHGASHYVNLGVTFAATAIGIGWALKRYLLDKFVPNPEESQALAVKCSWNKFYIDDVLYTRVIGGLVSVGSEVLYLLVDVLLIDTLLVHGLGGLAKVTGRFLRGLQTGLLNAYALGILGGVIVVLYWLLRG